MALLVTVPFYAQKRVAAKVQQLNNSGISFKEFSPLTATEGSKDYDIVDNETYATINNNVIQTIYETKPETIELSIPYQGSSINVSLYKVNILAQDFHADTDKENDFAYKYGVHYRGIIKNDNESLVSFSFFKNKMSGLISNQEHKNIVVARLKKERNTSEYIIYSDSELNVSNSFECATSDELPEGKSFGRRNALSTQNTETARCVTIYYEVDHDMYLANNSSTQETGDWLTSLFNNIQTLYDNDGIDISLKSFFIWTTPDSYSGTTSEDYLMQFFNNYENQNFDGDLGQLLAEDEGGLGGLAFLNGVCNDPINVSYVDVNDNIVQEVPFYSWSVHAAAHELGHQLGSPHTHACAWNGNNTAIDGCGILGGAQPEGDCATGPIPDNGGTIMSYCHLLGDTGINLANGFGEQPTQLITDVVNFSSCLASTCEGINCENGIGNINIDDTSIDNYTVTWSDSNNTTGLWDVMLHQATESGGSGWTEINTGAVNIQGLQPNTYYILKIRSVCSEGGTSEIKEVLFATDADWCEGQTFTDPSGANGTYNINQNIVRTFTPTEENKKIKVTFTEFELEESFDFLTVYDGPDTSSPVIGNFTGNIINNQITSTAADGSLTFEFTSDDLINALGWVASVECVNALSTNNNSFNNFAYYPNPANSVINISAGEEITEVKVYAISGQLLFTRKVNATQAAIDISALANGVYFFKATNDNKETNFRVVKQ